MNLHISQNNVPKEAFNELDRIINFAKDRPAEGFYEEYEVNDLYQIIFLEMYHMVLNNTAIKKCRNCDMYFVVHNLNIEYCDRVIAGEEKPCSEIGSKRAYQRKLEEDSNLKLYERAYKRNYARRKNGKISQQDFFEWQQEARIKLDQIREGIIDSKEYNEWIQR